MKYKEVSIDSIKQSKFNPSIRTSRENSCYKKLRKNIKENGLIVPIVLGDKMRLVDGHRRLNCFKDLGIDKIPAIVNSEITNKNYDKVFVSANEDSMNITPAQETERYLSGALISERTYKVIKELEELGGRNFIKRIVADGKSPNTYYIAINHFRAYTNQRSRQMARKVIYWMLNIGSAYKLKASIASFIPIDILVGAINEKQTIEVNWYKEEGEK
tara:strand:- start:60 stop:707 length:648 start_codon:yes stop_codon:yes gene_type:complete